MEDGIGGTRLQGQEPSRRSGLLAEGDDAGGALLAVEHDLSNLHAQHTWAKQNPKKAQSIAKNGQEVARRWSSTYAIR